MEEILASIRRIIADDTGPQARPYVPPRPAEPAVASPEPPAPAPEHAPAGTGDDILELTQPVDAGPAFTPVRGPDVVFREEDPRQRAAAAKPGPAPLPSPPPAHAPASPRSPAVRDEELLSPASTAAVSAAFNSLATAVISEHARTLEDIVKELMRPMLREWLDENLPGIVERMVRNEIERVSRGGR
jgi:cell pole-organizing protein PopZ